MRDFNRVRKAGLWGVLGLLLKVLSINLRSKGFWIFESELRVLEFSAGSTVWREGKKQQKGSMLGVGSPPKWVRKTETDYPSQLCEENIAFRVRLLPPLLISEIRSSPLGNISATQSEVRHFETLAPELDFYEFCFQAGRFRILKAGPYSAQVVQ